jgi:demethylmenaquinone methyltransferase/2-methoxy-6-polyprenyl-1,4-benzoquinol methylase
MTPTELDAVEARAAAAGGAGKRAFVRRMFSEIAPRYDLLNHVLSFNLDRRWRRAAIAELAWSEHPGGIFLDLCAGTLDAGAQLARTPDFRGTVLGADFAEPMLRHGRGKARREVLWPVAADMLALPLPDDVAAGAIVAFGIRNLGDPDAGIREVHRVLAAGARFVVLEFATPTRRLVRGAYQAYFHHVLPAIGRLVSGHPTAYRYLPESVRNFPEAADFAAGLRAAGFARVRWRELGLGIVVMHVAEKAAPMRERPPLSTGGGRS